MKGTNLGEFEELILLLVGSLKNEAYAVSIKNHLLDKTGRKVSFGALHSALTRLEEKGFLSSSIEGATSERRGRRKKFYSLTPLAVKTLKELHQLRSEMIQFIPNISLQ